MGCFYEIIVGFRCIKRLAKFRNGVFGSDLWLFGFGTEEGIYVKTGKGFDFVAVAFSGLGFWWDCTM